MREIKFRAIIKEKNATIHFTLEDLVNPNPLFSIRELVIPWLREGNKPDTCTNLSDKNSIEIYEGDIVKPASRFSSALYEVYWDERACQFRLCANNDKQFDKTHLMDWACEVIGNIYENPELLEHGQGAGLSHSDSEIIK